MRTVPIMCVTFALVAGCTSDPDRVPGAAGPVGDASTPATATPPAAIPSRGQSSAPPSAPPAANPTRTAREPARIRDTNWAGATIRGLSFCGESDGSVRFRGGSNGNDIPCRILPDGASPAYADFLAEEPANTPATDDALVLVELGNPGAARQQALVPVQLGTDGRTLTARPVIRGDEPNATGTQAMTFTAYRIDDATNQVIATVKRLDGRSETRRYRQANGNGAWQRL